NIQPVTAIIIMTTCLLGFFDAFLLVIVIVVVSNLYLGFGVWAIWQIIAWSIIALCAQGLMFVLWKNSIIILLIFDVFYGYLFLLCVKFLCKYYRFFLLFLVICTAL